MTGKLLQRDRPGRPSPDFAAVRAGARGYLLNGSGEEDVAGWLLTPRETHILDLVASGLGNVAIAQRLSVAPKTVRNTVSGILTKIGAADRADAVRRAREAGLGGP